MRRSQLYTALLLFAAASPLGAQLPAAAEARRAAVAQGLERTLQVAGRPVESYTVEERLRAHQVPAVSVAVVHDGRIDWAAAWGLADVASARAADTATLFQAASMSKPLAALGALVAVERGELALDDDVNLRLRTWRVPASEFTAVRPVTLRALLSHTAGTTVHGFPGYAAGAPLPTTIQVLDGVPPANTRPVRVDTVPGVRWRYSGGGTTIVQQLLTEVSARPFAQLLRERVLEPLGMGHSTFEQPLPDSLHARAATGYRNDGQPLEGRFHAYPEMAAAGLWTTPSDYARYILGVQRALRGEQGAILSQARAGEMLRHVMGGYGLGVGVAGEGETQRFSHGGANEGFRSYFVGFAGTGAGVVVMTNGDGGGPLAQELVQAVARVYGWPDFRPMVIHASAVDTATLDDYVGTYEVSGLRLAVVRDGERLYVSENGAARHELVPTARDFFMHMGRGMMVRFERDADGAVQSVRAASGGSIPRVR